MDEALPWIAFVLGIAGIVLAGRLALGRLKSVIGQFYGRLEAITREVAAMRLEMAWRIDSVAPGTGALRVELTPPWQDAAANSNQALGSLLIATRGAAVLARPNVVRHLEALRSDAAGLVRLSYGFARIARSVTPIVTRRNASRTIICSLAIGDGYRAKVAPALHSHALLAERLGVSHAVLTEWPALDVHRPPAWLKVPLVMNLFEQGFERVLYLDADALVTNAEVDIDAIFGERSPRGNLRLVEDEGGINTGVMFLQDGPAIRRLLDLTWLYDAEVDHGTWEQNALKTMMEMSDDVARHVTIEEEPRRFNSFAIERQRIYTTRERIRWQPGDFVCHFSGIRSPELEQLIAHYATEVAPQQRADARSVTAG